MGDGKGGKGKGGPGKGKGKGGDLPKCNGPMAGPKCWEKQFEILDGNNEKEWEVALWETWNNLGWLGVFGPVIILQSMFSIVEVFFWPEEPLSIDELSTAWRDMDDLTQWYVEWVGFVAWMGAPTLFMIT